jgi:hypothetical protein
MEEILSSIKRIIAEEGDAATGTRTRRAPKAMATPIREPEVVEADEILELSEPVAEDKPAPRSIGPAELLAAAPHVPEPILSERTAQATRGPLEALSRMIVRPTDAPAAAVAGPETLEGLVRELLKPMLSEWLDANLPEIVEAMVAREIERITGRQ